MAKKSAHLPASREPISLRPTTAAPPRVPRWRASRAVMSLRAPSPCPSGIPLPLGEGLAEKPVIPSLTRESNMALGTSANSCDPSLEAGPCTPWPALSAAAIDFLAGVVHDRRRLSDDG